MASKFISHVIKGRFKHKAKAFSAFGGKNGKGMRRDSEKTHKNYRLSGEKSKGNI